MWKQQTVTTVDWTMWPFEKRTGVRDPKHTSVLLYVHFLSCSHAWLTLTMEAKGSYKELLHVYQTTQYHILKDHSLDTSMRKSYLTWINHISEADKLAYDNIYRVTNRGNCHTTDLCVRARWQSTSTAAVSCTESAGWDQTGSQKRKLIVYQVILH